MTDKNPFFGATFAERKTARLGAERKPVVEPKQVDEDSAEVEDKAVKASETKKRTTTRKS